jgi:leader peptidase (prepilin peptidase) / N-methyltransferase
VSAVVGAVVVAAVCVAASPYLARLTLTVPDRENPRWLAGAPADGRRVAVTAVVGLVIGALAGAAAGWSALLPAYLSIALTGTPLTVIDYEHHRLPNRLVYPAAVGAFGLLALAAAIDDDWSDYLRAIEGAAVAYAALFLLKFISPRSFGWGDVRLGGVLGAYLGYLDWIAVYYGLFGGFLLGSIVAIALMASRRANMKTALAFGPMLLLGALIVLAFDITPSLVQ